MRKGAGRIFGCRGFASQRRSSSRNRFVPENSDGGSAAMTAERSIPAQGFGTSLAVSRIAPWPRPVARFGTPAWRAIGFEFEMTKAQASTRAPRRQLASAMESAALKTFGCILTSPKLGHDVGGEDVPFGGEIPGGLAADPDLAGQAVGGAGLRIALDRLKVGADDFPTSRVLNRFGECTGSLTLAARSPS